MSNKYEKPVFESGKSRNTRKGVKANTRGEKLVNVTNGEEIRRVKRSIASVLVISGNWKYCPKRFKVS